MIQGKKYQHEKVTQSQKILTRKQKQRNSMFCLTSTLCASADVHASALLPWLQFTNILSVREKCWHKNECHTSSFTALQM